MIGNIKEDLDIDLLNLDQMVKTHPAMLHHYSELLTEQKEKFATLELQRDIKIAEISKSIRKGEYPPAEGTKITETAIKEYVDTDPAVVAMQESIIKERAYMGKLAATVEAFNQRKYSLIKAVDLWIANYYSDIKPSSARSQAKGRNAESFHNAQMEGIE